jgi:hypothetical protein
VEAGLEAELMEAIREEDSSNRGAPAHHHLEAASQVAPASEAGALEVASWPLWHHQEAEPFRSLLPGERLGSYRQEAA